MSPSTGVLTPLSRDAFLLPIFTRDPTNADTFWRQFRSGGPSSAEIELRRAMLEQALADVRFTPKSKREEAHAEASRIRQSARSWIQSNDTLWPYSFRPICEALGLDPQAVRVQVLEKSPPLPPEKSILLQQASRVLAVIAGAGPFGIRTHDLAARTGLTPKEIASVCSHLYWSKRVRRVSAGRYAAE